MKHALAIAAIALGLGIVSHPTYASDYVVNGHAASPAEARALVAFGAKPGHWQADGYGISPAVEKTNLQTTTRNNGRKCWYVLDVLLCE